MRPARDVVMGGVAEICAAAVLLLSLLDEDAGNDVTDELLTLLVVEASTAEPLDGEEE